MRDEVKSAIAETIEGLMKIGIKTSLTEKELKELGIEIPPVDLSPSQIKAVRAQRNVSQAVFAKALNVSPSSIRQWEQGTRKPSGSTQVLLELLMRDPKILDYRLGKT